VSVSIIFLKECNEKVNELFQKLITKEPKYFDSYEKWKIIMREWGQASQIHTIFKNMILSSN
jgi:hypothetical protein